MQAKDRELAWAQQQLRQKVNSVNYIACVVTRGPPVTVLQEEQLRSSEALVADLRLQLTKVTI